VSAGSTSQRRCSLQQSSFSFDPVQLELQPADLGEQCLPILGVDSALLLFPAVGEQLGHLLDGRPPPVADLHRVHAELRGQLIQRPLAADRLQRHLGFELRAVLFSRRHHPSFWPTTPPNLNLLRGPNSGVHYRVHRDDNPDIGGGCPENR
jgi:hypothetical protein